MKIFKFWGESDDIFCFSVNGRDDEVGSYGRPTTMRLTDVDGSGMHVTGLYAPNNASGCWMIGISQIDEDEKLPDWKMTWKAPGGRGYSVELTIEAPNSVDCEILE